MFLLLFFFLVEKTKNLTYIKHIAIVYEYASIKEQQKQQESGEKEQQLQCNENKLNYNKTTLNIFNLKKMKYKNNMEKIVYKPKESKKVKKKS